MIGDLLATLGRKGDLENAVVAIPDDPGQSLNTLVHEPALRIPLPRAMGRTWIRIRVPRPRLRGGDRREVRPGHSPRARGTAACGGWSLRQLAIFRRTESS
jgi:hypothetical protein